MRKKKDHDHLYSYYLLLELVLTSNNAFCCQVRERDYFLSNSLARKFFVLFLRFGTKAAVVGTAVYVTVDNSIWDKSDYAKGAIAKVKTSLPETTDLFKNVSSTQTYLVLFVYLYQSAIN